MRFGFSMGYAGSQALAAILYQTSLGDFVYSTDASGNAILDNQGSLGSANDGLLYSGRGIELGATNDVDIPIHHTLGSELLSEPSFDLLGNWSIETSNWTIAGDGVAVFDGLATSYIRQLSILATEKYLVSFEVTATSGGSLAFGTHTDRSQISAQAYSVGTHEIELYGTDSAFYITGSVASITLGSVSVKQITNPNSFLTYYDFTDGLVTLGNSVDGGSSDNLEKVVNGGFDNTSGWTLDAGWSISAGEAHRISTGGNTNITQTSSTTLSSSKTYLASITVSNYSSGEFRFYYLSTANIQITANGTYTAVFNGDDLLNQKYVRGFSDAVGTIDNISIQEILPISTKYTLNTKTVNNIITHTTPWSASDWTKVNNNPNLIGKLALETTGATKTIPELDMVMDAGASADSYYMCSEKSGAYLVDSRVAYGADGITNGGFETSLTGWQTFGTTWSWDTGRAKLDSAVTGYIKQTVSTQIGTNIIFLDVDLNTMDSWDIYNETEAVYINNNSTDSGSGLFIIFTASQTSTVLRFYLRTATGGIGWFDNISSQPLSTIPIANYASTGETIRTNADLQQKGIQTTAFVTDGAGIPTSYSDNLLQFNGDGRYVDTGWIPSASEDFSIELVQYINADGGSYYSGAYDAGTARLFIGELATGNVYARSGSQTFAVLKPTGYHHAMLVFTSSTNTIAFYVDNVLVGSAVTDYTTTVNTFKLGILDSVGFNLASPLGSPLFHKKALTLDERTTAYEKAKTIYTSLP